MDLLINKIIERQFFMNDVDALVKKSEKYLIEELLPFWINRCWDEKNGGFITNFDENGNDTGLDEKSLLSQTRMLYSLSSALRSGYLEDSIKSLLGDSVNFLMEKMWDKKYGGFYWMADRSGNININNKILYGQSFAILALSEYSLSTGEQIGIEYANITYDLIQKYCTDILYGGYYEMFECNWDRSPDEGDRKTFDTHMHLMEAYTTFYESTRNNLHRTKLVDIVNILTKKMLHPEYNTSISHFSNDWKPIPQIRFDIIWGLDRFPENENGDKSSNITSYGHNIEFAWLLMEALDMLNIDDGEYMKKAENIFSTTIENGIDSKYGGIFVEGYHWGEPVDRQKEFWQQAEALVGTLEAFIRFKKKNFWEAFLNVYDFVFNKVINHKIGEWWPLLDCDGKVLWKYMGNSWKISYHTIRSMIQTIKRLKIIKERRLV